LSESIIFFICEENVITICSQINAFRYNKKLLIEVYWLFKNDKIISSVTSLHSIYDLFVLLIERPSVRDCYNVLAKLESLLHAFHWSCVVRIIVLFWIVPTVPILSHFLNLSLKIFLNNYLKELLFFTYIGRGSLPFTWKSFFRSSSLYQLWLGLNDWGKVELIWCKLEHIGKY